MVGGCLSILANSCLERPFPRYHLFGHEHDAYGILKQDGTVFSNAALLDRHYVLQRAPRQFLID